MRIKKTILVALVVFLNSFALFAGKAKKIKLIDSLVANVENNNTGEKIAEGNLMNEKGESAGRFAVYFKYGSAQKKLYRIWYYDNKKDNMTQRFYYYDDVLIYAIIRFEKTVDNKNILVYDSAFYFWKKKLIRKKETEKNKYSAEEVSKEAKALYDKYYAILSE